MVISFLWFLWREPESCFEKVLNRTHVGDNQKIPLKGEKKTKQKTMKNLEMEHVDCVPNSLSFFLL